MIGSILGRFAGALILALVLVVQPASAQPVPVPGDGILVDLTDIDAEGLEALKHLAGVSWWIEAGSKLLLVGEGDVLRQSLPVGRIPVDVGYVHPDGLALHARGCNQPNEVLSPGALILAGETHDLVRRPPSFSPYPEVLKFDASVGTAVMERLAPNSVIARMRRLDREDSIFDKQEAVTAVNAAVAAVDADRWFQALTTLASFDRSSFSPAKKLARQWLVQQFEELGLDVNEPTISFPWPTPDPLANVVATWQGSRFPDEWIIIGAHYDSRNLDPGPAGAQFTPGADDNASGCAGVLEAARVLLPFRPQRSVLFICYAGEEQGLHGSASHVSDLISGGNLSKVKAMLNMDMIGWTPDNTLGVIVSTRVDVGSASANSSLANLLADAALDYVPALDPNEVIVSTASCCSDQMPYLNAGLPAAFSIHRGTTSYPNYHRRGDTPANLGARSRDIGAAIVRMNVAALAQLAELDPPAIEPGMSGLWFNPDRDGEGFSIDILDEDRGLVVWYTFDNDGSQMWLIGTGEIDGAILHVEQLVRPIGTTFGEGFDAAAVQRLPWGSLSIEFEDCGSAQLVYQGPEGYDALSHPLQRLAQMSGTGCGSAAGRPGAELSGMFFDPSRDGEGFAIHVVDSGDAATVPVGFWFTYTPDGEQAWFIGIGGIENGTRFVAGDVLQPVGAKFGDAFDPGDVERRSWGSWSIDYANCNAAALDYASELPGYTTVAHALQRLTRPVGVLCEQP